VLRNDILIASSCPHLIVAADNPFDIKSETLVHSNSAWNGVSYEAYSKGAVELSVLRMTIPPHSKLKWADPSDAERSLHPNRRRHR